MASPWPKLRCGSIKGLLSVGRFYVFALALSLPLAFMLFAAHRHPEEETRVKLQDDGLGSWSVWVTTTSAWGSRSELPLWSREQDVEDKTAFPGKASMVQSAAVWPQKVKLSPFGRVLGYLGLAASGSARQVADTEAPATGPLRVYMYELPARFNWDLADYATPQLSSSHKNQEAAKRAPEAVINGTDYPIYPGSAQRRQHSVAYWMMLDLLSAASHDAKGTKWERAAVRVFDPKQAEVFFVPFFSSLSYNAFGEQKGRNRQEQVDFVSWLTRQEPWKVSGGSDHVIPAHHPNALKNCLHKLRKAHFVVADFGRHPKQVSNVEKDVVAPYKHMVPTFVGDTSGWESRRNLLFFQGQLQRKAGGIVRQQLLGVLGQEKGVVMQPGKPSSVGVADAAAKMRGSRFCLTPAGDTPSSCRLFDAIASHCVPVVVSDQLELPFEDVLDYTQFAVFVPAARATQPGYLAKLLRNVSRADWETKWRRLKEVDKYFEYAFPPQRFGSEQMIWHAISRRIRGTSRSKNRRTRQELLELDRDYS